MSMGPAIACAVMAVQDAALDTAKVDGERFTVLLYSGDRCLG